MVRKQFDKELYNICDKSAKKTILDMVSLDLRFSELKIVENQKKTAVDLQAYKGEDLQFNVEVEIKKVWKTDDFPYDSVQFPERKEKYAKLDKPTFFCMFNNDLTKFLIVKGEDLLHSPKEIVRNRYVSYGEYFFKVPLDKAVFNDISILIGD